MAILTLLQQESLRSQGFALKSSAAFLDDGTFSTVLAVTDASGQDFAVKIVDKLLIMKHDKCKAVLEEKRIHSALSHTNIVKLFSTFQDEQSLCNMNLTSFVQMFYVLDFVLELCEGGNLLKFKEKADKMNQEAIKKLANQLISAVEYLHSQKILHRDIKPENILITRDGDLKLADFGSALSLNRTTVTDLNSFVGTPEYLAPEILRGAVKIDQTAFALDWWAVGCTIYWLLTRGKVLFEAPTEYLVYKSIESGPTVASLKECCDLDGTLAEIIFGLLEREPQRRINFVHEQLKSLLE